MNLNGNTILITGGGTGIGAGLAREFHARGNKVIIAGRRLEPLQKLAATHPGMVVLTLDVMDKAGIAAFSAQVTREHPDLNILINNAGIMRPEDLTANAVSLEEGEQTIAANLLGPVRLASALLPHLRAQTRAAVINVTSGLAFLPLAMTPMYNATKAALHSYTQSMRFQLRNTSVQVIEIIPPYVQTELTGPQQASDPRAMPLDAFIQETMANFEKNPDLTENCVEAVLPLRKAEVNGGYDAFFQTLNNTMSGVH